MKKHKPVNQSTFFEEKWKTKCRCKKWVEHNGKHETLYCPFCKKSLDVFSPHNVSKKVSFISRNKPRCNRCGFDDIRALCLDHINDDGNKDRLKIMGKNYAGSGSRFYVKLRKMGYPKGYQTLCSNCNLIKEIEKRNAK